MHMKEVEALISLGGLLTGAPPMRGIPEALKDAVLHCRANAQQVAEAWLGALEADTRHAWANPITRGLFLAALSSAFEKVRANAPASLATALSTLNSHSGSPLNVQGTRRELLSRAAEALFKEARRKPSDTLFNQMLVVAETLFTKIISDYAQRAAPHKQRAWYGMRGVCRLMLNSDRKGDGKTVGAQAWMEAADDLEAAFNLGNCGPSAATYVLDALMHWMEYEPGSQDRPATRFANLLARLNEEELSCRAVQTLAGRHHFARWFREPGLTDDLETAIAHLDAALLFPVQLAHEDHFVRHIRGQVGVRLALALRDQASGRAGEVSQRAIEDLLFASEANPAAFGDHPSLPSLLLSRAEWHGREGAFDAARADLWMVLGDPRLQGAPKELRDQARGRLAQVDLIEGLHTEDMQALAAALRNIVATPPLDGLNWVIFAIAAKRLFMSTALSPENGALLEQIVSCLANNRPPEARQLDQQQQHLSHVAGLTMHLVSTYRPDLWPIALERFNEAIALFGKQAAPNELLSLFADLQLQTAKRLLTQGQDAIAEELLGEAAYTFSALADGIAPGDSTSTFRADVAQSKAGEAFHRLAALTSDRQHVESSIRYFERAQVHGNDTHNLLGLLGDAHYRKYRISRDAHALDKAIEFKQQARICGGATRENLSLSGRLHYSRWQLTGDKVDLVTSADLIAQAAAIDTSWPWPPFQLHEYLSKLTNTERSDLVSKLGSLRPKDELLGVAMRDGMEGLARLGSMRALTNGEFARKLLGGRSGVYVLADPHGLLGSSYVFKHTDSANAQRDVQSVAKFGEFLHTAGLPLVLLPETVALFPNPRDRGVVHVMRRAKGFQLGQLAIRAAKAGVTPDTKALKAAVTCLAAYHAWGTHEKLGAISLHKFMKEEVTGRLADVVRALPASTEKLLTRIGNVTAMRKKDAHPENWLVDESGRLVMIDFESRKGQPALYDTALLLDDYPFLPINKAGWAERMARCHEYIKTLTSRT